jgi:hypothetical protein
MRVQGQGDRKEKEVRECGSEEVEEVGEEGIRASGFSNTQLLNY